MTITILDRVISSIKKDRPVREVRIGPFWTAVQTDRAGLASTTFVHEHEIRFPVEDVGMLTEKSGLELCEYSKSESLLEASVGVATINSMLDVESLNFTEINASEVLFEKGAGKRVAIVGHFPFVADLRKVAKELWVIERRPQTGDLSEEAAERVIPKADVVAITGTALINGTIGRLLELCPKNSIVMVLGPSTPLSTVWFDYGVDLISGTIVTDPELMLRFVSEGIVFKQLRGRGVSLVTMSKNNM